MIIPTDRIAPELLTALVEEFVGREGTDYGMEEYPFQEKVDQLMEQLHKGDLVVLFDTATESTTLALKQDALQWLAAQ